jgi:parallel beta-helix repeat protein
MSTKSSNTMGINWESNEIAERRNRGRAQRSAMHGPATQMMRDLAEVKTGARVLDVAAGTGDQTLMAAQRVGATGYVLATDISASMLKLTADTAREAGLTNIETRVMDAENIDLEADSFDAVICQLSDNIIRNNTVYAKGAAHDGTTSGILVSSGDNNLVYGNDIYGNQGGIQVYTCGGCQVFNNTLHDNDRWGEGFSDVDVTAAASGTVVENNIFCNTNRTITDSVLSGNSCSIAGTGCATVETGIQVLVSEFPESRNPQKKGRGSGTRQAMPHASACDCSQ